MNAQTLKLTEIITDAGTQTRCCITEDVVAEYAERWLEGDKFPPVIVFHDGTAYYLADGFHRVLAAQRNGFKDILAEVHKGTAKDALKYALGANQTNGLRRTNADKHRCTALALNNFGNLSSVEISKLCGVSHTFVDNKRRELATVAGCDADAPRMGGDGKTRKLPERNISPPPQVETRQAESLPSTQDTRSPKDTDGAAVANQVDPFAEPAPQVDYFKERLTFLEQAIQQVRRDFPARDNEVADWLENLSREIIESATVAA